MGKGGDSTDDNHAGPSTSGGSDLLQLPRFQPFLDNNFNVAEFTSKVLGGSHTTASAQSEQLRDGVHQLESALSDEVVARNKELLHHVRRMLDAENSVRDVVLSVESLQSAVRRIRAEVVGPYEQIKHKTQQLRNIHATVDILRHVIHRLKLAQKLRAQLAVPAAQLDLAKAAKLITDIRHVDAEVDLSAIEAVAADAEFLESARKSVQEQAEVGTNKGVGRDCMAWTHSTRCTPCYHPNTFLPCLGGVHARITSNERCLGCAFRSAALGWAVGAAH